MNKTILLLLSLAFLSCSAPEKEIKMDLGQQNGLQVLFSQDQNGSFEYQVNKNGESIIERSKLGLKINDTVMDNGFEIVDQTFQDVDKNWTAVWGANKNITDKHKSTIFTLKNKNGRTFDVEFRVFDDAIAFRYLLKGGDDVELNDELSYVDVAGNPNVWYSNANYDTYESEYFVDKLDSVKWIATPVVMKNDKGLHIAINEAGIVDYPDATLKNINGVLKFELVPYKNSVKAYIKGDSQTPWRVINITDDAKGMISSNVILNLNQENKIENASEFCKPMTYVGIWWDFHLGRKDWKEGPRQGANTYDALRAIDFAFRNKIDGVLIEGWNKGWDKWGEVGAFDYVTPAGNYDLKKIADYAKTCKVRLIMHFETGADIEGFEKSMDSAFMMCKELGISDVKTGHAGKPSNNEFHHNQKMVQHFDKIAKTAAKYSIALDLHESVKGSGLERTYPNVMTRENVRGLEWEAWSLGNSPNHTVLIPFVRGLAGPTDYTPGIFDILYKKAYGRKAWNCDEQTFEKARVHSTLAHQLSLMLTIYSPWVMAADRIDIYDGHPAFKFVSDLNPDYDESKVVDAQVGQYIVVARRSGDVWYIGATTNAQGREISVPLSFLGQGKWSATVYRDGDKADWINNPTDYKIENVEVDGNGKLDLKLANGGGAAVVLKKI